MAISCFQFPYTAAQVPGDDEEEKEDDDSDVPLAEGDKKPAAKKTPEKTVAEAVEDLSDFFETFTIDIDSEMKIKIIHVPHVRVRRDVVRECDVLAVQVRMPGGAVLDSLRMDVDANDPNKLMVSCRCDPFISNGRYCTKPNWHMGNNELADRMQDEFDTVMKEDVEGGQNYEVDESTICFPNGLKVEVNERDPHQLGFRRSPTHLDDSFYEIERCAVQGSDGDEVVPCFKVTAFFFVALPTQRRTGGGGLRIGTPSPTQAKRSRGHSPMDEGTPKKGSAAGRKPPPPGAGAGFLSFVTFGLLK